MKKTITLFVLLFTLILSQSSYAVQIAPSPLAGPEFKDGEHKGKLELVYINYENVYGGGLQGTKRYALSDLLAITPSLGVFYLSGDQTYTDSSAGKTTVDLDYAFASAGLRLELQQKVSAVNFILFGGPLFHYGESDNDINSAGYGEDKSKSRDTGYGWEAGLQAAIKTGPFTTTVFYKYEELEVETKNIDDPNTSVESVQEQEFTFKSSTIGVDIQFEDGISLSALYNMPDNENEENVTIIKVGFSF